MKKEIRCPECRGVGWTTEYATDVMGYKLKAIDIKCNNCNGTGKIEVPMTNFDRIKNMDETELAMFIESIAQDTIRDYRNGFFSKWATSTFETIAWLRSEAKE